MSSLTGLLRTVARPTAWSTQARAPLAVRSNWVRIASQHRHLSQEAKSKIDGVRFATSSPGGDQRRGCSTRYARIGPADLIANSRWQVVQKHPLVLFMKGTPSMPQCGFSRAVCQILEVQGVSEDKIVAFNCLEDPELREGIKEYRCGSPC